MFQAKTAFSGFSVNDLAKAKEFYAGTLGLKVDDEGVGMRLHCPIPGRVPSLASPHPTSGAQSRRRRGLRGGR